ncbi:dihydroxyacetone kinase family protein [Microbacterium sp. 18062]|uniref:dihydroxyacetone kinase family protein n=1 Tax=Microbacterium sp. 18062 TaxID=2681410 RepID=UPI00135A39E4|nr:dihydroxyacetone kinase family protein [Microbacterium sp. 18062]
MTRIVGAPDSFADEALAGFCDLYPDIVRQVPGGAVRARPGRDGKTALVVGGGSGHFPAFAGFVGTGFADGAVCGDVFASPSAKRVHSVVRHAERGGGVVLGFGNYAGDVLNFTAAADELRAEGVDVRVLAVTDDLASAPAHRSAERRGVAGDLVVFKIAGAAAEAGLDLDEVERLGRLANERTRSLGVAFRGCTLPGSTTPLFEIGPGRMGVGIGIHGEPGTGAHDLLPAPRLAEHLVEAVLAEAPAVSSPRVAVVLNGLGSTKHEELFVLWSAVAPLLRANGLELVAPEASEFVTSFDMAGCSLTVTWLGDELEQHWTAPSEAVGFHRRRAPYAAPTTSARAVADEARFTAGSPSSRADGRRIARLMAEVATMLAEQEAHLGRLDAQSGDGDHGQGMARGSAAAARAAADATAAGAGAGSVLTAAGDAWADRAGGTSGALWGAGLAAAGHRLGDTAALAPATVSAGVTAALDTIVARGGAALGDKTLVDALVPFAHALADGIGRGEPLPGAWRAAAAEASAAADRTAELVPRRGRARTAGSRNVGHVDAGAVSLALVMTTIGRFLDERQDG